MVTERRLPQQHGHEVSIVDRPKILLTGKPLFYHGRFDPRPLDKHGTVWDVVTDPRHRYLAVISGDIHNYQRYLVTLADGRRMPFIVSGGGCAFLHGTHTIPNLDLARLPGVDEESFRCYPLRGDSLARSSQLWSKKLGAAGMLALDQTRPPRSRPVGSASSLSA